ncbi:MAG: alkaline phosphatase D family protein [Candidatus Rokubacteria bacterium]|nr:alkaline phosphatase D family protein [Candidatus Rokubacteria bacterium]
MGEVTPTGAIVWARATAPGRVTVEATAVAGGAPVVAEVAIGPETDLTGKVALTNLRPATRYRYRVTSGGETVTGEFATAPASDTAPAVTLLWSGDLGSAKACRRTDTGYRIFTTMAQRPADFFLFVFVARTVEEYRAKHRYNREDPAAGAFYRRVPVFAIWDDHEVFNDFSGPTHPRTAIGRRAFLDYWPLTPPAEDPVRLYRRFQWGRLLEVFILDTRSYRSPNAEPDGPGKTMLGRAQREWLVNALAASPATWKIVVTSVPLSVPTGRPDARDSWTGVSAFGLPLENATGFAVERDRLLRLLRDRGVKNLVFLAADVHHAELIRHEPFPEFAVHEFIAGPLSASVGHPRPLDPALNPRSLFARGDVFNFGEITVDAAGLTVRIVDVDGAVLFTHTIGPAP